MCRSERDRALKIVFERIRIVGFGMVRIKFPWRSIAQAPFS